MSLTREAVRLFEMGPRDGLQSERSSIALTTKITLVNQLSQSGLQYIETGSFVSPKWVPQMADSAAVFAGITRQPGIRYTALTPNMQGLQAALTAGADEVAVFASASEGFSQKNLNCDIQSSLQRFAPVIAHAKAENRKVRGYISCILDCPYDGKISHQSVLALAQQMLEMGCYEISLGDTIGTGTAGRTKQLLTLLLSQIPAHQLALHCHDTYGQAIANIYAGLELGLRTFDASVGGLGGCPYAKGATGNVATEDVVYLLEREGFLHGVDLDTLAATGLWINQQLQRSTTSRAGMAILNSRSSLCV